jgi:hypothetical protein
MPATYGNTRALTQTLGDFDEYARPWGNAGRYTNVDHGAAHVNGAIFTHGYADSAPRTVRDADTY